jgi:hypothetical protein
MVMVCQAEVFHHLARKQSRPPRAFRKRDNHISISSSVTVHHYFWSNQSHPIGCRRRLAPLARNYP